MVTRDIPSSVANREQLWIAGESGLARAIARLAQSVDFDVTHSAVPEISPEPSGRPFPTSPTSGLILLDHPEDQVSLLQKWSKLPFAFLGVLGSRERKLEMTSRSHGTVRDDLERVVCLNSPGAGLSTEEAAITIVAQLIQNRSERRISYEAASRIRSPSLIRARAA